MFVCHSMYVSNYVLMAHSYQPKILSKNTELSLDGDLVFDSNVCY